MKAETYCTLLTAGGDLIEFTGIVKTPISDLTALKVLLYSTIYTLGAHFMARNI